MNDSQYFYSPLDGMLALCNVTPALNLLVPICTPVLARNTTQWLSSQFKPDDSQQLNSEGVIKTFCSKATGFHRPAELFEQKNISARWSNKAWKIFLTAGQFATVQFRV